MILQLDPVVPLLTPKGQGMAHFLIDYGQEHHLLWVVFIDETGECWTYQNPEVRLQGNVSMGRKQPKSPAGSSGAMTKRLLIVAYDPKTPGVDLSRFVNEIQRAENWWNSGLKNTWLLISSEPPQIWSDKLRPLLGAQDTIVVMDVALKGYAGWMPQDAWPWLQGAKQVTDSPEQMQLPPMQPPPQV